MVDGVDEYANSRALLTKSSRTTTHGQAGHYRLARATVNHRQRRVDWILSEIDKMEVEKNTAGRSGSSPGRTGSRKRGMADDSGYHRLGLCGPRLVKDRRIENVDEAGKTAARRTIRGKIPQRGSVGGGIACQARKGMPQKICHSLQDAMSCQDAMPTVPTFQKIWHHLARPLKPCCGSGSIAGKHQGLAHRIAE
jgi:hypothetical protein